MEPIVNPWFFYWVEVLDYTKFLCGLLAVPLGAMSMGAVFYGYTEKEEIYSRLWKKLSIATSILILLMIFAPNKSTCYKMLVASMVTPDNIAVLGEKSEKAIDAIIEKIVKAAKELENGNEKKN